MQYLSSAWIEAADHAVRSAAHTAPAGRVIVDQIVEGGPSYRVVIERTAAGLEHLDPTASASPADAIFRQNIETARDVARGTTDAHQAFLLGRIRFEGSIDALIEHRDAFAWLERTLAPLLAETTF